MYTVGGKNKQKNKKRICKTMDKCIEHMYSNLMSKIPLFYLYHPLNSVEHI